MIKRIAKGFLSVLLAETMILSSFSPTVIQAFADEGNADGNGGAVLNPQELDGNESNGGEGNGEGTEDGEVFMVKQVSFRLSSSFEVGLPLPASAVFDGFGLAAAASPINWVPSHATVPGMVESNTYYTGEFVMAPAARCLFPESMDDIETTIDAYGAKRVCSLIPNGDGTVTASFSVSTPALVITAIDNEFELGGFKIGIATREEAVQVLEEQLPSNTMVTTAGGSSYGASISWDTSTFLYDTEATSPQTLQVKGTAQLQPPFIVDRRYSSYELAKDVTLDVTCQVTTENPDSTKPPVPTASVVPGFHCSKDNLQVALSDPLGAVAGSGEGDAGEGDAVTIRYAVDTVKHHESSCTDEYGEPIQLEPGVGAASAYVISCYAVANRDIEAADGTVVPAGAKSPMAYYSYKVLRPVDAPRTAEVTVLNGVGGGTYPVGQRVEIAPVGAISEAHFANWTSSIEGFSSTDKVLAITVPEDGLALTANFAVDYADLSMPAPIAGKKLPTEAKPVFVSEHVIESAEEAIPVTFLDENGNEVPAGFIAAYGTVYTARFMLHTKKGFVFDAADGPISLICTSPDAEDYRYCEIEAVQGSSADVNEFVVTVALPRTFAGTPVEAPGAATGLVYNGKAQTGVAAAEGYTVTGGSAVNAGTHTATATLEEGYVWMDGTREPKSLTWTIEKAAQSISVSKVSPATNYNGTLSRTVSGIKSVSAKGTVTFSKMSVSGTASKNLTLVTEGAACKIKVAPKTPVGTYGVTIRVKAAATANFASAYKDVTVNVKVSRFTPTISIVNKVNRAVNFSATKSKTVACPITKIQCASQPMRYELSSAKNASGKDATSKFTVNKTTGAVTVKAGTPKDTYKVNIKVLSDDNANYKGNWRIVAATVKVV